MEAKQKRYITAGYTAGIYSYFTSKHDDCYIMNAALISLI